MAHRGKFTNVVINFLWPLNPTKYAVFVAGNYNWQIQSVYQIKRQYFRWAQLNIFSIPAVKALSPSGTGSHVFHGEIVYTYSMMAWTPSKYALFVPLSPSGTKFCIIPWKHRNSVEMGKFRGSAQNSTFRRKLWSLLLCVSAFHFWSPEKFFDLFQDFHIILLWYRAFCITVIENKSVYCILSIEWFIVDCHYAASEL